MGSQEIVLYPGRNDIAYVNRELATARDRAVKRSVEHFRVSDLYIGRYAVLGFVELCVIGGRPNLAGIVEVPERLVQSMRKIPGMMGYVSEVVFRQDKDFTTVYGPENLQHSSLEGVILFDSKYYWYPRPEYRRIDSAEVGIEIKLIEQEVIEFLTGFDAVLDKFVPEDRKPTYSSLPMLGPGHIAST